MATDLAIDPAPRRTRRHLRVGIEAPGLCAPGLTDASKWMTVAGGADSLWLPDHLIGILPRSLWQPRYAAAARFIRYPDGYLDPYSALGFLAARSRFSRIRLGVGVTDPARRNPAVVAQAFASLNLLSRGRVLLGIGAGAAENASPYGISTEKPVSRLEEALGVIRALWSSNGGPVSREGRFFPLQDALFDLPAHRGAQPPIFVGGQGPRMLKLTALYGDGWLPNSYAIAGDLTDPSTYGVPLAKVRSIAAANGRNGRPIVGSGWFGVITAPTEAVVDEILGSPVTRSLALMVPADQWARHGVAHPMGDAFKGPGEILPHLLDEETALSFTSRVPDRLLRDVFFVGTPAALAERFRELARHGLEYPVLTSFPVARALRHSSLASMSFLHLVRLLRRI